MDPETTTKWEHQPMASETVMTYLTVHDGNAAMECYEAAFGAIRTDELHIMEDGRVGHAELRIGTSTIALSDEFDEMNVLGPISRGGPTSATVLSVDDVDSACERAVAAGLTIEREPDNNYGVRMCWLHDPFGHRWSLQGPET